MEVDYNNRASLFSFGLSARERLTMDDWDGI
jgi:hypothetical protein